MEIFIQNIILIILISINTIIFQHQCLKFYQEIRQSKINLKKNIMKSKTKNLQDLKNVDLKAPLYAKLSQEDKEKMIKATENIKQNQPEIYLFTTELLKNVKIDSLRNLIINAPYITINYHKTRKKSKVTGTYNGYSKKIDIYDTDSNTTLYHELLHAASTSYAFHSVGFKINLKEGGILGEGLNEGYTELLNNRFFNCHSKSYIHLQKLAKLIENFYENKDEMTEDYFNADLFGLIGELLKSMSLEEIIDILVDMDQLLTTYNDSYVQYLKIKQKLLNIYYHQKKENTTAKSLVKKLLVKK